jgi:hypothetical protein
MNPKIPATVYDKPDFVFLFSQKDEHKLIRLDLPLLDIPKLGPHEFLYLKGTAHVV